MRFLLAIVLSLCVFAGTTPKAQAIVGVAIKSRTIKVVGGVVGAAGVAGTVTGIVVANALGGSIGWALLGLFSMPVAVTGLVILDEKNADLKFSTLTPKQVAQLPISVEELNIYNTEVEELNAVKEMIESRVTDKSTKEEIHQLWSEYKDQLSPETLKVAAQVTIKVLSKK